jgi:hypothetical protein
MFYNIDTWANVIKPFFFVNDTALKSYVASIVQMLDLLKIYHLFYLVKASTKNKNAMTLLAFVSIT